jgi:anaerobic magnesium-protoporphyrin IX monomethyl ester cyclase
LKVALINPIPVISKSEQFYGQKWPPLGILLLGTILNEQGHQVYLLDQASSGLDFEQTLKWIKQKDPEIVGITAMTVGFKSSVKLTEMIKQWDPNLVTVLGHYHPTVCANKILENYGQSVDYCVRGENEYILSNLINFLEKHQETEPKEILGLSYRHNDIIKHNPNCPTNKNLDDLPFPDRSLLKNKYYQNLAGINLMNSKFATTFFTRGCPFNCSYCSVASISNQQYRSKSPQRLVEEFSYLATEGYSEIAFVDDNFSINLKKILEFCRLLRMENIDINWHVEMRVDGVSKELFGQLVQAGCKSVNFGIESANPRILSYYNKKITPEQSIRAIAAARKARIEFIIGLFMIGAPFETIDECKNTINFALKSGVDFFFLNLVETWPGIPMWNDLINKGLINEDKLWEHTTRVVDLTHSPQQINLILDLIAQAYRDHISYKNLGWIIKLLLNMPRSAYKRKIAVDFMKNINSGMKTFVRLRNLRLTGFGKFKVD